MARDQIRHGSDDVTAARIVDAAELDWLLERLAEPLEDPRHHVSEILPAGYDAYVRVLDPWSSTGGTERRTWRELAVSAGIEFYPEISWLELEDVARRDGAPSEHLYSGSDPETRGRVIEHLAAEDEGPYIFSYELLASIAMSESPMVVAAETLDLSSVRAAATAVTRDGAPPVAPPEHWWPASRSWVVSRDDDLDELYIACSRELAQAILDDADLEAVEVSPNSRVDWSLEGRRGAQ